MKEKSRTEHSIQNASIGLIFKIISLFLAFITRVVFTHTLSETYVGANGLFVDIVNVLNLTELGVGTAITYAMYKPIAENDFEMQKALMRVFRSFYYVVAASVFGLGICVLPFLQFLIKDTADIPYLRVVCFLYILNAAASYLLSYKRTIVDAHQNSYISTAIQLGFLSLQYIVQIFVLLLTRNYILYAGVAILCTFAGNVLLAVTAERMYPYIRCKNAQKLPSEERKSIVRNIRAMMMHKVGDVIVSNTDHLLLSTFVGLLSVGCYSNYFLVIGSVRQVFCQMFSGINASIGNLGALEGEKQIRKRFLELFFICEWLYGFAAICLFELASPFISFSFGEKYVFTEQIVMVLSVNFYINGMRQAVLSFRDSLGLFWYDRYKSIAEGFINLVVSIVLAKYYGAIGVFIGTFVSTVTTSFWVEPFVLYKYRIHKPLREYFVRYAVYVGIMLIAGGLTYGICQAFTGDSFLLFMKRLPVCLVLPNVIFLLCFRKTEEFTVLWKIIKKYMPKRSGNQKWKR